MSETKGRGKNGGIFIKADDVCNKWASLYDLLVMTELCKMRALDYCEFC